MKSVPPRSPLSFPGFRRFFLARAVSSAGSYMQIVAATWYVYQATGNAASVGLLSALALGPAVVGGPIGGALADRYEPRRLAIVLYLLQGAPATVLAILDLIGDLPVGWLYVLVFAGAIPYSLNCPVVSIVATLMVPEQYRQAAVAQSSMMFNITRLAGAVAGGFVVHWLGIGTAFALNAASYFLVAAVLAGTALVSGAVTPRESSRGEHPPEAVGLQSLTKMAAVGVGVFFTFIAPVEQLMPTVAEEHGMTAAAVGLLIGSIGVGAILANPIIGKSDTSPGRRRRLMAAGMFLAAPGMIILAITPQHGLLVDLPGAMMIGFGWEFVFIGGQSTVAIEVPENIRGRMMGLFFVLVTATTALGAVGLGFLINGLGLTTTFLLTAGVAVAAAAGILVSGRSAPAQVSR